MSRVCTLVALTAAALLASAGRASAAHVTAAPPANAREGVNAVTAVSIVPSSGRAEVVVALSGPVEVQDFVLTSPNRVVIDLSGARLNMPPHMYDKVSRAGITNVRIAQYKPNVVRLVLELDSSREYEITRHDNEIRIAVTGPEKFAAWHAGDKNASNSVASTGTVVKPENTDRTFAASPAAALKERLTFNQQRSQQPRITVTYPGSDIRDVIAAFATFSGRTIVIGKDVQGTVTAEIKDQPWDVALQAILQSQGLAASEENTGIISVDSYANILAKEANEPLTTQLVSINYASASSLVGTFSSLLSKVCS
jgi:type IV pilus assembly protein PilQ